MRNKKSNRVGFLFSSTGVTSIVEKGLLKASLLALEQVNGGHGIQLDPIVVDIKSNPDIAAKAAHDLLMDQEADFLIGCYTSSCRKAIIPVLEETKGFLLYPTSYEGEEAHPQIVYLGAVPNQHVDPLLSWAMSHISKDFVLVGSEYVYPRVMNRQVRSLIEDGGGRVIKETYFPFGCVEFSQFTNDLKKLYRQNPNIVVFSTLVGTSISAFYKQYSATGLKNPIFSPITSEVELSSMGSLAAAGHYFSDGRIGSLSERSSMGFVEAYRQRHGDAPSNGLMEAAYNAVHLLGNCYRNLAGGNRATDSGFSIFNNSSPTPDCELQLDMQTQHAWLWSRVLRVNAEGKIEEVWTSPGAMPPRPFDGRSTSTHLPAEIRDTDPFAQIVGKSDMLDKCIHIARIASGTSCPILLTGETGTGKERFARAIHEASARSKGPFIAINCAAIPRDLIASELFGYEGGAFTGARKEGKKGKFELADQGTLFLDEIAEMPLELQTTLLRALQEKKILRIGGSEEVEVDIRIIAATNKDVSPETNPSGPLRADLFYRLNVFGIDLPPLRARQGDIPMLVQTFLHRMNLTEKTKKTFSPEAMSAMESYTWPGNIRELGNVVERAYHMAIEKNEVDLRDLPLNISQSRMHQPMPYEHTNHAADRATNSTPEHIVEQDGEFAFQQQEREAVERAITMSGGNMTRVARALGISRSTLYRKLKVLSIVISDDFPYFGSLIQKPPTPAPFNTSTGSA